MNTSLSTALLLGTAFGSCATMLGIFIAKSVSVAATLPMWLAIALAVGATLVSVTIGAAIVAIVTAFLMRATGDLSNDIADAITQ